MIVVDVNALAYLWIPGEMTATVEKVLRRDPHWVTSILWRSEFRNVLAGYLRRGVLDRSAVAGCIEGAETQMAGREYAVPSALVMRKVEESSCSAYDCEYVALADDLGTKLVTSDAQILRDFHLLAVSPAAFIEDR